MKRNKELLDEGEEDSEKAGLILSIQKSKIMAYGPIISWQIDGEKWKQWKSLLSWAPKSMWTVTAAMKLKGTCSLENLDKRRQCIKKQRHLFANKDPYSQRYGFSSSHVWMWEVDHKENLAPKNWCFQFVVLEKNLENPLYCNEIKSVSPKGNQPWIFIWKVWCWSWSSNALVTWCQEPTHRKSPWWWERLKAKEERVGRGWDG